MKLISIDNLESISKDVTLQNGAKHRCIDATQIYELPKTEIIYCKDCYYFIPPEKRDYHCYSCRETWSQHTIVYENDFCSKAIRSADVYMRRAKDGEQES